MNPDSSNNEEEDVLGDNLTSSCLLNELFSTDEMIIRIRNDKDLDEEKKFEKLHSKFEKRNKIVDMLTKTQSDEFKQFIETLNLKEIKTAPYFPSKTKRSCLLVANDVNMEELSKLPQKKKKLFGYDLIFDNSLQEQYYKYMVNRKEELLKGKANFEKKKILSPAETARKLRITFELDEIEKYLRQ